jgi:predicted Zn-dependent protease with MMP-like domain
MKDDVFDCYIQAGKVAARVLQFGINEVNVDASIGETVEAIEKEVLETEGVGLAFPLNLSLNEDAAHDTAMVNDERKFQSGDLVKLDLGVHIDGYIADIASTVNLGNHQPLIESSQCALEAAIQLSQAEVGSLLLVDEERYQLYFEVVLGDQEEVIKSITLELGEGIAGWVAQHGKPLIVNAPEKDPRFFRGVDEKTEFKTRNLICVPVKVKEKVIGVLEAINKQGEEEFNQEDLDLLTSLADQVAIALDNARLYQELEEMFFQTADSLADAIEKRDPYTGGHTQRVTLYSQAIAKYLQLNHMERKWLKIASVLHDIGKIGIEDKILKKPERLNLDEFGQVEILRIEEIGKDWQEIPTINVNCLLVEEE